MPEQPRNQQRVRIAVGRESESRHAWRFEVALCAEDDKPISNHEITLSWVDYEHWTHGQHPPVRVVEMLVAFLLERMAPHQIPDRFDAARIRRFHSDVDDCLPAML